MKFTIYLRITKELQNLAENLLIFVWHFSFFFFNFQVSDFGLAKFGDFSQSGQKFPIKWTAPEALRENVHS